MGNKQVKPMYTNYADGTEKEVQTFKQRICARVRELESSSIVYNFDCIDDVVESIRKTHPTEYLDKIPILILRALVETSLRGGYIVFDDTTIYLVKNTSTKSHPIILRYQET